jgi:hypothetical protein
MAGSHGWGVDKKAVAQRDNSASVFFSVFVFVCRFSCGDRGHLFFVTIFGTIPCDMR